MDNLTSEGRVMLGKNYGRRLIDPIPFEWGGALLGSSPTSGSTSARLSNPRGLQRRGNHADQPLARLHPSRYK
jgi:hypothetical protein